jgi:hypothetical protein
MRCGGMATATTGDGQLVSYVDPHLKRFLSANL